MADKIAASYAKVKTTISLLVALAGLLIRPPCGWAAEGGGSAYLQGTYNDFAMGIVGPPGFYVRNDTFYYDSSVGAHPLGGLVAGSVNQQVWVDTVKFSWVSPWKILGGTYNAAIALPIILDAHVSGGASAGRFSIL